MKTFSRLFLGTLLFLTVVIVSACIPKAGQLESEQQGTGDVTSTTGSTIEAETAQPSQTTGTKVVIDPTTSTISRRGTKVIGGGHNGTVGIREGFALINNGRLVGGEITLNMNAITVLDIPAEDASNVGLVNHLIGPDFFDVKKFPTAQFIITSVNDNNYPRIEVNGIMTIKDQSHPETIILQANEDMTQLSGSIELDRTKYGVMYNSEKLLETIKDRAINDMISLNFSLILLK
ncbi:MAG: YceI family protein [Candidatus Absconditabacterales bacterium]|nr:YceI family protein [Candidatus Absconditabacterales bacterium]